MVLWPPSRDVVMPLFPFVTIASNTANPPPSRRAAALAARTARVDVVARASAPLLA